MTSRKPERSAFLISIIAPLGLLLAVIAFVAGVAGLVTETQWAPLAATGLWVLAMGLVGINAMARYRKERYEVYADRIVVFRGGLFSDEELEVHYPNITHVKWVRPWLWHTLFGVGNVYIEVAGSAAGKIAFQDIANSAEAQTEIRALMEQAFSMRTDELLHEESPAGMGILLDVPLKGGWMFLVVAVTVGMELLPLLGSISEYSSPLIWAQEHAVWLLLIIPLMAIALLLVTLRCLDLKRRTYRVYNGVIEYHEGFLTRNDAFMPVENLSNSEISRGIAERFTRLYNVVVSCQGAGQEVAFLYLRRGPELNAVLDRLIDQSNSKPVVPSPRPVPLPGTGSLDLAPHEERVPESVGPDLHYRMNVARTLTPMVFYLLLIPLMIMLPFLGLVLLYWIGQQVIRMFRTAYSLRANSVEETYDFIRVKQREFSKDKITGVVFREHIFDRFFNTITIQFWSIGAGQEIAFQNIKKTDELMAAVRQRAGIRFEHPVSTFGSDFGLGRYLFGNIPVLIFCGLASAGAATAGTMLHWGYGLLAIPFAALVIWSYVWGLIYYPRSELELHDKGLIFRRGIITRSETYARFRNIKDITTIKIPGHDCGAMRFNVAGERTAKQDGAGGVSVGVPYGFTMHYVPELRNKDELFDYECLAQRTLSPETETGMEARKALGNTLVRTLLTSIILFPLIVLLPITLPVFLWRASLVRYRIESGRVLMRQGRLFRSQTSILFSRIDHIQVNRGALNKLFGNGTITISTAGSSRPELVLRDIKDHEAFYQALRARHRGDSEKHANADESLVGESTRLESRRPETSGES